MVDLPNAHCNIKLVRCNINNFLWPPCVAAADIIFCPVISFYFFNSSPNLSRRRLDVYHTLGCMSETCCTWLAENTARKKSLSAHHRTILSDYIFAIKVHIDNRKNLLNSNISCTRFYNMVNFGPLAAHICWRVWGTPTNFNSFRVLAALLHGTQVVSIIQTLRR